jgi:hypothetical protein
MFCCSYSDIDGTDSSRTVTSNGKFTESKVFPVRTTNFKVNTFVMCRLTGKHRLNLHQKQYSYEYLMRLKHFERLAFTLTASSVWQQRFS